MKTFTQIDETTNQLLHTQQRRSYVRVIKRCLLALLFLVMTLPIIGLGYEATMTFVDAQRFPPPGKLIAVNGHQMHLNCTGTGSPTVVMDAGLGGWSLDWNAVQPGIAQFTRVCSYDRAGLGWSQPGAAPGDAQQAIDELHTLLMTSDESGPFVLVGHSNGGLRTLLYAYAYPQDVSGIVLVDPTPRAKDAEMLAFLSPTEQQEYLRLVQEMNPEPENGGLTILELIRTLRPFGVSRLLTDTFLEDSSYPYVSADQQPAYRFGINQPGRLTTTIAEIEQRQTTIDRVRAIPSLGALPLAVLTSTKMTTFYQDPLPAEPSGRLLELIQKTLWEAEADLSHLSSHSTITPIERSGHFIQFDRPDAVIDAVQTMIEGLGHS